MRKRHRKTAPGSQAERAVRLLAEKGMVRRREFLGAGVAPETLARLVRNGRVCRVARGLYQRATLQPAVERNLAEVSKLVPRGVVCLVSALRFHGLTSELPAQTWIAIPSSNWKPIVAYPPVNPLFFGPSSYSIGIETHRIERVPVRIYGIAKTIVDCFRYRNKIGIDRALDALRRGLAEGRCSSHDILAVAEKLRAARVIIPYLESAAR
jgi:predicted transcriptional regulator of viral defense system